MVIGKCPRLTAEGLVAAIGDRKLLAGLRRLGVVVDTDLGMLWGKQDKADVRAACERQGVCFETSWSWDETECVRSRRRVSEGAHAGIDWPLLSITTTSRKAYEV
jgi:hypothetical protein